MHRVVTQLYRVRHTLLRRNEKDGRCAYNALLLLPVHMRWMSVTSCSVAAAAAGIYAPKNSSRSAAADATAEDCCRCPRSPLRYAAASNKCDSVPATLT